MTTAPTLAPSCSSGMCDLKPQPAPPCPVGDCFLVDWITPTIRELIGHEDWPNFKAVPRQDGKTVISYPDDENVYFLLDPDELACVILARNGAEEIAARPPAPAPAGAYNPGPLDFDHPLLPSGAGADAYHGHRHIPYPRPVESHGADGVAVLDGYRAFHFHAGGGERHSHAAADGIGSPPSPPIAEIPGDWLIGR